MSPMPSRIIVTCPATNDTSAAPAFIGLTGRDRPEAEVGLMVVHRHQFRVALRRRERQVTSSKVNVACVCGIACATIACIVFLVRASCSADGVAGRPTPARVRR